MKLTHNVKVSVDFDEKTMPDYVLTALVNYSEKELNDRWYFKKSQDTLWKNATVPGTVHTDLISLQEIEEPYYRLNEIHNLLWVLCF